MCCYYFVVTDGHGIADDPECSDLDDAEAARSEAARAVLDLLATGDRKGLCRRHWRMDVQLADGTLVFSLPFSHALQTDRIAVRS